MMNIFITFAVLIAPLDASVGDNSKQCLAGMRDILIAGNFTGPLICEKDGATFNLIGKTSGAQYYIYDYRYRYMPKHGNVMHGGQKIVIFHRNKYIGQYALSPPPYANVTVRKSRVLLKIAGISEIVSLNFYSNPPKKVLINGEIGSLYR